MQQSIKTAKINLCQVIVSVLLLSSCSLVLIDLFRALATSSFCTPWEDSISLTDNGSDPCKKKQLDISTKQNPHDFFQFFTKVAALLVNLLAALSCILAEFCASKKKGGSESRGGKWRIPFPRYSTHIKISSLHAQMEFASFLFTISASFGSLIVVIITMLKYSRPVGPKVDSKRLIVENVTLTWLDTGLCEDPQWREVCNPIMQLFCDIILLAHITNFREACYRKQVQLQARYQVMLSRSASFQSHVSPKSRDIQFCVSLTRIILVFSSAVITSGGLVIISCVLKWLSISMLQELSDSSVTNVHIVDAFCFVTGSISLCAGLQCVAAIHCCTMPLELLPNKSQASHAHLERKIINLPSYLLAFMLIFLTIPCNVGICIFLNIDPRLSNLGIGDDVVGAFSTKLPGLAFTLIKFASQSAFVVATVLLASLLLDFCVRMEFLSSMEPVLTIRPETFSGNDYPNITELKNFPLLNGSQRLECQQPDMQNETQHKPFDCGLFTCQRQVPADREGVDLKYGCGYVWSSKHGQGQKQTFTSTSTDCNNLNSEYVPFRFYSEYLTSKQLGLHASLGEVTATQNRLVYACACSLVENGTEMQDRITCTGTDTINRTLSQQFCDRDRYTYLSYNLARPNGKVSVSYMEPLDGCIQPHRGVLLGCYYPEAGDNDMITSV
ncbi:unnamed protein product [Dicrocoelium dendriticum]|nr:unnamed protein product [Dicrocoelium dendriticum]